MRIARFLSAAACLFALASAVCAAPVAPAGRPMLTVDARGHYKAVYDIHSDEIAAGISKGLYYARGLYEAFGKQGVKPSQLDVHLVLHGEAAQFLLVDDTWQQVRGDPFAVNLNAKIVQDLLDLGVHVEICHSVMKAHGWTAADVLPGVTLVHDGYTRLIKLQNDGYAYIGGF
ncbi:MAG: DsrE family protein [Thiobacillus sp.]|nr:DsrE family protein [Thiobacillus sp.]